MTLQGASAFTSAPAAGASPGAIELIMMRSKNPLVKNEALENFLCNYDNLCSLRASSMAVINPR